MPVMSGDSDSDPGFGAKQAERINTLYGEHHADGQGEHGDDGNGQYADLHHLFEDHAQTHGLADGSAAEDPEETLGEKGGGVTECGNPFDAGAPGSLDRVGCAAKRAVEGLLFSFSRHPAGHRPVKNGW